MSLRVQACEAIAGLIREQLGIASVEIIAAPPSKAATYPACARLIDRTDYWTNDDFIPVDADNKPLIGPDATLDLPVDWGRFDRNTLIYRIGRYMMHGRIFVATRHPDQRAELEDQVLALFFADDLVPGRILVDVEHPKVLGRILPWAWPIAAFLPEEENVSMWNAEFAFDERLWSYMKFDIDVDIIVPRSAPMIEQLIIELTTNDSPDVELDLVAQDGTISIYSPP